MRTEVGEKLKLFARNGHKGIAWLIDPDDLASLSSSFFAQAKKTPPDLILVGGSLLHNSNVTDTIRRIREEVPDRPIVIFPGSALQICPEADALLFISLISGRNPDLLIGQHVSVAPLIADSGIEVMPTGYLLVDGGQTTSAHYVSQTMPLPNHRPELCAATALAGSLLGLQYFYLDTGSGAPNPVSPQLIAAVKKRIHAPILVGGGLNSLERVKSILDAGADIAVIGNGIIHRPALLAEAVSYTKSLQDKIAQ